MRRAALKKAAWIKNKSFIHISMQSFSSEKAISSPTVRPMNCPSGSCSTVPTVLEREKRLSFLIVEHRLEDVLHRPVDRIILINEGRIVADLPPR